MKRYQHRNCGGEVLLKTKTIEYAAIFSIDEYGCADTSEPHDTDILDSLFFCEECEEEVEQSEIEKAPWFLNRYRCTCGEEWENEDDCTCNDRCPKCRNEMEPFESTTA